MEKLGIRQARKIALHAQRVLAAHRSGRAIDATRLAVQALGYVQIDTISVVERAHHHTLWNRNPRYRAAHLDRLVEQGKVFEYWSHAAAYLPIEDYRMCLPRMERIRSGDSLWFKADPDIKRHVLERIRQEGPLQSRDFVDHGGPGAAMWEWKPAKYALETLFMEGELMVVKRNSFQKVYDLTERVLDPGVDTRFPARAEFAGFLIDRFLGANGLGTAAQIGYLRKGLSKDIETRLAEMEEEGELVGLEVAGVRYHARPGALELLDRPLSRAGLRILSPFDNLVIQRQRILHLFGFDYQIECYVPQAKRRYGYFCLPVLWDARLVARLDCKADRKTETLIVRNAMLESGPLRRGDFCDALGRAMSGFAAFNGCRRIRVEQAPDRQVREALAGAA